MSLEAIKIYLTKPRQIIVKLSQMDLLHWVPDDTYLRLIWSKKSFGGRNICPLAVTSSL